MDNLIRFIGRLVADPETRAVGETNVTEFRVASDVGFGDRKTTNWFRVSVWNGKGAFVMEHFKKGKPIQVTGQLRHREYTDKEGTPRSVLEVEAYNVSFVPSFEPRPTEDASPVKPATGTGLIGQSGNRPGTTVKGSVQPTRPAPFKPNARVRKPEPAPVVVDYEPEDEQDSIPY